jgi:YHS domain-containing protein
VQLSWNYTTILNIVFLAVLAGIYWLHRNKERLGGGRDVARDPVCGMQVDTGHPGAVLRRDGQTMFFCSEHCRDRYRVPAALPGP